MFACTLPFTAALCKYVPSPYLNKRDITLFMLQPQVYQKSKLLFFIIEKHYMP